MTPSLQYVKDRLKPLQSVIADDSYWFDGTLGAYGIPEWYAHSFRTDREKEVLGELVRDPFSSPTSMVVLTSNIQFDSPLMDRLVIKYLLVNRRLGWSLWGATSEISTTRRRLPDNSWTQHISMLDDMESGLSDFCSPPTAQTMLPQTFASPFTETTMKFPRRNSTRVK
jgi:hypothetical protein